MSFLVDFHGVKCFRNSVYLIHFQLGRNELVMPLIFSVNLVVDRTVETSRTGWNVAINVIVVVGIFIVS
uniref:Uncharacterized protein n=1 Tax=Pararge aegeria TaxID=116150 RepID=S4P1N0_9NEOP